MGLKKKLDIVFKNESSKRYIPRAHPDRDPGTMGWLVFDQHRQQFLSTDELAALSDNELRGDRPQ